MRSGRGGSALVLAGSVALVIAVAGLAIREVSGAPGATEGAARIVPAGALAFIRLTTDEDSRDAQRLARLAPRIPGFVRLRERLLAAVSGGAPFDLRRDVRPWLGDEAAVALVDLGAGRFASLILADVKSRPGAEALLRRVPGAQPGARYRGVVVRRFGDSAAAFVEHFLVAGPEPAVRLAIDTAKEVEAPLARAPAFEAALGGEEPRPLELYLSARGLRGFVRARGGALSVVGALLDTPEQRALGAGVRAETRGLSVAVRRVGAGGEQFEPRLVDRVPADAAAYLGAPRPPVAVAEAAGGRPALDAVRRAMAGANVDLDRDLLGPLRGEFAAWLTPGAAAPVIAFAARTRSPRATREALARLHGPLASLAGDTETPPVFRPRTIEGVEAFSLPLSAAFEPTYAVRGDTVVVATAPSAVAGFLGPGPRLRDSAAFRATVTAVPPRAETLGFLDVRQLLALGEQTGLTVSADLSRLRAAGAVSMREEDDTTAELFFEIP